MELDIIERRGLWDPENRERNRQRLDSLTQSHDEHWSVGWAFFTVKEYGEAARRWEEEGRNQGRLDYWHWAIAANILSEQTVRLPEAEISSLSQQV